MKYSLGGKSRVALLAATAASSANATVDFNRVNAALLPWGVTIVFAIFLGIAVYVFVEIFSPKGKDDDTNR